MELQQSQNTVNETHNKDSLIEAVPIDGTPFTAIRTDQVWFLTLGKYRLSEKLNTLQEVKDEALNSSWIRVMQIMRIVVEEYHHEKELEKTIDRQQTKLEFEKAQNNSTL